jgi:hypothetical protein
MTRKRVFTVTRMFADQQPDSAGRLSYFVDWDDADGKHHAQAFRGTPEDLRKNLEKPMLDGTQTEVRWCA